MNRLKSVIVSTNINPDIKVQNTVKQTSRNSIILNIIGLSAIPFIGFIVFIGFVYMGFVKVEKNAREATNLSIMEANYQTISTELDGLEKTFVIAQTIPNPQVIVAEQFRQFRGAVQNTKSSLNIHYQKLFDETINLQKQISILGALWDKQSGINTKNNPAEERLNWVNGQIVSQKERVQNQITLVKAQLEKAKTYQNDLTIAKLGDIKSQKFSQLLFLITVAGAALAALVFISFLTAKRIAAPISQIKKKMESFNRGNLNETIDGVDRKDEFGDVARLLLEFKQNAQNIRELQQKLRATIVQKQKDAKMKEDILLQMGEDFKSPLNNIMGFGEDIQKDLKYAEQTGKIDFEKINNSLDCLSNTGQGMISMVDSVIDLTQDSGSDQIEPELFNVREEVQKILPHFEVEILKNKNKFRVACPDPTISMTSCPKRVMKAVSNLIKNAAKATNDGTITLEILHAKLGDSDAVCFTIIDNGAGLDYERIKDLNNTANQDDFSIFSMGHIKDGKKTAAKSGLGLVLVKKIVKDLFGTIHAERNKAKGTKITVTFPSDFNEVSKRASAMTLSPLSDAI